MKLLHFLNFIIVYLSNSSLSLTSCSSAASLTSLMICKLSSSSLPGMSRYSPESSSSSASNNEQNRSIRAASLKKYKIFLIWTHFCRMPWSKRVKSFNFLSYWSTVAGSLLGVMFEGMAIRKFACSWEPFKTAVAMFQICSSRVNFCNVLSLVQCKKCVI